MRLIGIGLLAFLLAGLALLLARSEMVGQGVRAYMTLTDGPQLRFETPIAAQAPDGAYTTTILRAGTQTPIILSGLPAYQGAVFHMPIDAGPTSGYLQIDATSQVMDGVAGVLRISIDNTRRAEVLLHPGEAVRSVRIELTAADIARAQLVVSFSLQGEGASAQCSSDRGIEAVVEIETTSALFLTLDTPLDSPRDRVAAVGGVVPMHWTGQTDTFLRVVDTIRNGAEVVFVPSGGLDPAQVEEVLSVQDRRHRPTFGWSDAMSPTAGLYDVRRFQHRQTWRIHHDPLRAENTAAPATLDLSMFVAPHPFGADWHLSVTLNGRLVHMVVLSAQQQTFRQRIALPASDIQGASTIEITLTSTFPNDGPCNDGPEVLAEISTDSQIIPSEVPADGTLWTLIHSLKALDSIAINADANLTAAEASVAACLLADLLPSHAAISASVTAPLIQVLPRGAALPDAPGGALWLIHYDPIDNALLAIPLESIRGLEAPTVGLLVDLRQVAT